MNSYLRANTSGFTASNGYAIFPPLKEGTKVKDLEFQCGRECAGCKYAGTLMCHATIVSFADGDILTVTWNISWE